MMTGQQTTRSLREIKVTPEMIDAGAAEIAAHGPDDSSQVTAWAVFLKMARLAGFEAKESQSSGEETVQYRRLPKRESFEDFQREAIRRFPQPPIRP
jgi:hypothetical protein